MTYDTSFSGSIFCPGLTLTTPINKSPWTLLLPVTPASSTAGWFNKMVSMSIGAIYEHLFYIVCNCVKRKEYHKRFKQNSKSNNILSYPFVIVKHQLFNSTDNKQTTIVRVISNIATLEPTIFVVWTNRFFHIVDISFHVGHRFNTNFAFSIGTYTFASFQANNLKKQCLKYNY